MQLDHSRARLPQTAVLRCEAADAVAVGRRTQRECVRPVSLQDNYGGGMPPAAGLGAVAGGIAATGMHFVDGASEKFADLQNLAHLTVIIRHQIAEHLPLVID